MISGKPGKKTKALLLAAIVLVLLIVMGRSLLSKRQDKDLLTAGGTVEAVEMDVSSRVAGRIVTLAVEEGDSVRKGQVIAVLDAGELKARVEQAEGALAAAEAGLAELLKGSREEKVRAALANYRQAQAAARGAGEIYGTASLSHARNTELKARLEAAEAGYRVALDQRDAAAAALSLVSKGTRPETIDRLKAGVSQARALLDRSEQDYKRLKELYEKDAVSEQQKDAAVAARLSAQAGLEAAEAAWAEAVAGPRSEEIDAARARLAETEARLDGASKAMASAREAWADRLSSLQQVQSARTGSETAEARVAAARAELDLTLAGATSEQVTAADGRVKQARGALEEARSQLSQATILSPEDGVVTVKVREAGEVVSPGVPIIRIADLDRVWLRVYAPLTTLGRIEVGQSVSVGADTWKDKRYQGRVAAISQEPEFTPKSIQTQEERVKFVYAVRIEIDDASRELKPGMPADAYIHLSGSGR